MKTLAIICSLICLSQVTGCASIADNSPAAEARHVKQVAEDKKQQDYKALTTALSY